MNINKNFIFNNIQVLSAHILIYTSGLFLTPLVIKTSGEEIYGKYVLLISVTGFIFGISSFGVGYRAKRFLPGIDEKSKRIKLFYPQFNFQLITNITLSIITILIFPFLEKIFFDGRVGINFQYILIYLLVNTIFSQTADFFRNTHRITYFNLATLFQPYLHIGISLSLFYFIGKLSVQNLFNSQIVSLALIGGIFYFLMLKEIGINFSLPKKETFPEELKFGLPLLFGYIIDQILAISDRFVIAGSISSESVGYYAVAYSLGNLPIFFAKVSGVVLPPILARQVDKDEKVNGEKLVEGTILGFIVISFPFILGSLILGYPILNLYASQSTAEASYFLISIISLGVLFYGLSLILMNLLFISMETKEMLIGNVTAALVNLILNLIFIPIFKNNIIAAITTVISYIILFLFVFYKIKSYWTIKFDIMFIIKIIVSASVMFLVLFYLLDLNLKSNLSLLFLIKYLSIAIIIYFFLLFILNLSYISKIKPFFNESK